MKRLRLVRACVAVAAAAIGAIGAAGWNVTPAAQGAAHGSIKGHVKLMGKLPGNPIIRMGMDPKCAEANRGKRVIQEYVAATIDGSLANVFIHLQGTFPRTAVPAPIVVDQRACVYHPRVLGAVVGQVLQVKNSDDWLHNVHGLSGTGNSFNVSEPKAGMVQQFTLKNEEVMLKIKCDVHSWMIAYVGVVPNPYFAVSNEGGLYEIGNVPPGSYTILTWHERFGPLTQKVTVKAGATTTIDFAYTGTEKPPAGS
jgi:plastocyanin